MSSSDSNSQNVNVVDVVALISQLRTSRLGDQLNLANCEVRLQPIVDELNALVLHWHSQSQTERENMHVIDLLGIGIWKWDLITNSLEWDENMYRLYDADPKEFNGAYDAWENSLSPETKAKAVEEINSAVNGKKDFDTTFQVVHKSGKVQEIRTRAFVIRDENGKPQKMHGINVDRTREAELERGMERERAKSILNAKLASLGEMSAGIAHEINNPLAIIACSVGLIPKYTSDLVKLKSRLEVIENATNRIAKIVQSLRKFSRSDEKSQFAEHDLVAIVKESIILTESHSRRHTTTVIVESRCHSQILCNEIEIEQVMVNLINNAIDAVKRCVEKWVHIELFDDGPSVVLRVKDSGPGISSEIRHKLFQPFFTTKPVGQGTGLGLSIAKGILDEHHATIELIANDPHTCFEIRFPRSDAKNACA